MYPEVEDVRMLELLDVEKKFEGSQRNNYDAMIMLGKNITDLTYLQLLEVIVENPGSSEINLENKVREKYKIRNWCKIA